MRAALLHVIKLILYFCVPKKKFSKFKRKTCKENVFVRQARKIFWILLKVGTNYRLNPRRLLPPDKKAHRSISSL